MNTLLDQSSDASRLLQDTSRAGVYSADEDCACSLYHAGPGTGFNVYRIDLGLAHDVDSLHHILSHALHFPDWYGSDWEALAERLSDMSWNEADGYLLILQRTDALQLASPQTFHLLLKVLGDTVQSWREQKASFWTLFIGEHPELPRLEMHT